MSSENDGDETMEDLDDGDEDQTNDMEVDAENDDEGEEKDDGQDADDVQDSFDASPLKAHNKQDVTSRQPNGESAENETVDKEEDDPRVTPRNIAEDVHTPSAKTSPARSGLATDRGPFRPPVREVALTASLYDIGPTIAAPHSTSINAVTATPDMRLVFSGGTDGWVRKFNWVDTANSKLPLTVAQRHPFVDSVTKAGVLSSYWGNVDTSGSGTCNPV